MILDFLELFLFSNPNFFVFCHFYQIFIKRLFEIVKNRTFCDEFFEHESLFLSDVFDPFIIFCAGLFHLFENIKNKNKKKQIKIFSD